MFSGASNHTLDAKGRAVLPARFRFRLGESFMITRGLGGCLWVFDNAEFDRLTEKLAAVSLTNRNGLALQRFFLGAAVQVKVDNQGRVPIPAFLREVAGIRDEMVVVGVTGRVEIWGREAWDRYSAESLTDENIEAIAGEFNLSLSPAPPAVPEPAL